jgi:hypothetical protein
MILPNLKLVFYTNLKLKYLGIDTYERCSNKEHFLNYPYEIDYVYNSRGFRGPEWPSNIDNVCWCIGDSFTSGIGSTYEHIWPSVLSTKLSIPVLNVSLDGASNMWMARKTIEILEIQPKYTIIQWTFSNRREIENSEASDEHRRTWYLNETTTEEDIQNTIDCINLVEINKKNTTIIHTFVPKNVPDEYQLIFKELVEKMNINIIWFEQIDYARDYFHYDIKTCNSLVEKIIESGYINI